VCISAATDESADADDATSAGGISAAGVVGIVTGTALLVGVVAFVVGKRVARNAQMETTETSAKLEWM
jgi:formiminotetrahydrofolate cyclodeaminase